MLQNDKIWTKSLAVSGPTLWNTLPNITNAHDALAGNSHWNPESGAGFQREFPARVATKFALVSNEKTWQMTKMLFITIKTMMFTTYIYRRADQQN